jgi:hypothetical protein
MVYIRFGNPNLKADWSRLEKEKPSLTATLERAINAFYPNPGPVKNPPPAQDTLVAMAELASRNAELARWVYGLARFPGQLRAIVKVPGLTPETVTPPGCYRNRHAAPPRLMVPFDSPRQMDQWDDMGIMFPSLAAALELVLALGGTGVPNWVLANPVLVEQYAKVGKRFPDLGKWLADLMPIPGAGAGSRGAAYDRLGNRSPQAPAMANVGVPSQEAVAALPGPLRDLARHLEPHHMSAAEATLSRRSGT